MIQSKTSLLLTAATTAALSSLLLTAQAQACSACLAGHPVPHDVAPLGSNDWGGDGGAPGLFTTVPQWSSRPGAPATLHIDFDGIDFGNTQWGGGNPGVQPAYSRDNDTSDFSQYDIDGMNLIWSRVTEAFSPFDINVTTVDPGNRNRREVASVAVTGTGSWFGSAGGVAYLSGFVLEGDDLVWRTSWAFEDNYGTSDNSLVGLGDTISHEAGHMFGLGHQSLFDGNGNRIDTYRDSQDGGYTDPIMGGHYEAVRSLWSDGPTGNSNTGPIPQDDLAILASTTDNRVDNYWNGFGYREDDHAGTSVLATLLMIEPDDTLSGFGVIENIGDTDLFAFSSTGGIVDILAQGAQWGQMLDILLNVYDAGMNLVASIDPALSLDEGAFSYGLNAGFSGDLDAGSYFVELASHGNYGDVGQYFLNLSGAVAVPEPGMLSLLGIGGLALLRRRRA